MAKELAFVLINPYTIRKSRTGGVIARLISRTQLDFVGARMYGPSKELAEKYAQLVRDAESDDPDTCNMIADYILRTYSPDPVTGKVHRVMLLLFEGEDAVMKVWRATGSATLRWGSGETIRDTYGDYVVDEEKNVQYFEPAVLVAPNKKRAAATLNLWAKHSSTDAGIIATATDVTEGKKTEKTLVLIKPDNFRFGSGRAGNIIDTLSTSGLRIIGVKKFSMTVAQAEEFYGPVRDSLKEKFRDFGSGRAAKALSSEFGFEIPLDVVEKISHQLGPLFANAQFEDIVRYMTGYRPSECSDTERSVMGSEDCLALVYDGTNAVQKIRTILGSTDPRKAEPGSVRREFGSDIMVNAAHASDSAANAQREIAIINMKEGCLRPLINKYYGNMLSKFGFMKQAFPKAKCNFIRNFKNQTSGEETCD